MPRAGETLVQLPRMSQASAGLRRLYERVESGVLPTMPTTVALAGTARDKTARYPHGKRVGPYLLGKTIGQGSFAKVKEGLHSVVGEKVAIKVTDKKVIREDPYLRKNMRREAGLLQSLRHHPNIVSLYEVMETDNNFYMVLELCTGGALLDRICSEKCLLEEEARRYVGQIVSAVDHMHQAGILHRDLKVENLLLDGNNDIKIIDFGLSTVVNLSSGRLRAEFRGTQCGSPAYAAPEIIANKKYGAKVDVWSIGVNTFAMMAGCLPFTVEPFNIKLLVKKINNREMAEIPVHLSHDCKDFIRKLLHPDPRVRYSVQDALNHPWLAGAAEGATPRPPRTPSPPPPGGRLSRMELETDILEYIWTHLGYNVNHVANSVIRKRADEYSAVYYLLLRKRDRQHLKMLRTLESAVDAGDRDAKDAGISGPKLYDEATAMELTGRKHGSLHFKMALLLEQEIEAVADNDRSGDEEKAQIGPTNQSDPDSPGGPIKSENRATSPSPRDDHDGAATTGKDHRTRALKRDSGNAARTGQSPRFRSNMTALRAIKSKALATAKINESRPNSRMTNAAYKPSPAHTVNLTFKQSDTPAGNFADHFNYRKGEGGPQTRFILAPTPIKSRLPNKGKAIPITRTWRPAESIDSVNLQNRMNGLRISPRTDEILGVKEKRPGQASAAVKSKPSPGVHRQRPAPPDFEVTADRRRQLRVSKRKSVDNLVWRRSTRTAARKRASSDAARPAGRAWRPGRPATSNGPEPSEGPRRKIRGTAANQRRRGSRDKASGHQKQEAPNSEGAVTTDSEKSEKGPAVRGNSQVVHPSQAVAETAASPSKKPSKQLPPPPKACLTNKKLACNAVSAETVV